MKKYHFITLSSLEDEDRLSSAFEELAESVCMFEDQNTKEWFFEAVFCQEDMAMIQTVASDLKLEIEVKELPDVDWLSKVHEDFPPLSIGDFYVYGSHVKNPNPEEKIPLLVDAATAFGSGHHESTTGCLIAFTTLKKEHSFSKMLDMGCGSGILALAMASLWKGDVLGVDNDPEAVKVSIENTKINKINNFQGIVNEGFSGEVLKPYAPFDLIAANILAGPLMEMASDLSKNLAPNGFVVLAGLLSVQAPDIIQTYENLGIYLIEQLPKNEWSTLVLQKKG
jgi:ribosomal protein L11 methyltransferase